MGIRRSQGDSTALHLPVTDSIPSIAYKSLDLARYNHSMLRADCRRRASRDSTNQNASFVERLSRSERAVFRGICGEIFALFQACVGNFDTIPPRKVVGTLYLDSSCVIFKYFAFLSVCDKFELLGHVQAAMMI